MARKTAVKAPAHKPRFHPGQKVGGKYRSATWTGKVVKVIKHGTKESTTEYAVKPDQKSRHAGEPLLIHRHGDKMHPSSAK